MMRAVQLVLAAVIAVPIPAAAVCPKPSPKVCNEFFKSSAVVVGTVIAERTVAATEDFEDGWTYRIRVQRTFRGARADEVSVFTENTSARLPLVVGRTYLLFADRFRDRLQISDCGNTGLAAERQRQLHALEKIANAPTRIEGHVAARPDWVGAPGERLEIVGAGRKYSVISDDRGAFSVEVAPGSYVVSATSAGIDAFDLSYDDPAHVTVERGQCAQVQFVRSALSP